MLTTTYINRNYLIRVQPLKGQSYLIGATRFFLMVGSFAAVEILEKVELRFLKSRTNRVSVRVGNLYINFIAR